MVDLNRTKPTEQYHVLVVDDNPALATLTAESLEHVDEGLRTSYATDPEKALKRLREEHIDCLVTDYEMPSLGGLELVDRDSTDTPFILYTQRGEQRLTDAVAERDGEHLSKEVGSGQYRRLATLIRKQAPNRTAQTSLAR